MAQKLKIIPLGGLGEIGKNMMIVQYGKQFIVVDSGLLFPEDDMLGIDFVIPDYTYIKQNSSKMLGIILTHGHEDHIGGLSFLLQTAQAPIYGTKLTLGLAKSKLNENKFPGLKFKEISPEHKLNLGPFKIQFIPVSHSIPDGVALSVETPIGRIVHTGDFKLDQMPIDGRVTDLGAFSEIGKKGVLLLMSDSTNAEAKGMTLPEKLVGETLDEIFGKAQRRIIVASFASHLHRIQQILDIAKRHRKKVLVSGRTMLTNIDIAQKLGYLKIPEGIILGGRDVDKVRPSNIVVLCTGSQGEPLSALTRIAFGGHKQISIEQGDTVIIAAAPVPGNEKAVSKTINMLYKGGAEVHYEAISKVHVSGHACSDELRMMLNLVKPKYFMPIHGEHKHLHHHSKLAQNLGINKKNIFVMENGEILELSDKGQCRKNGTVPADIVYVDGGIGDVGKTVLQDRHIISKDGICVAAISITKGNGQTITDPVITLKGVVQDHAANGLVEKAAEHAKLEINRLLLKTTLNGDMSVLDNCIKNCLSQYFYKEIKRRPVIIPVILEV